MVANFLTAFVALTTCPLGLAVIGACLIALAAHNLRALWWRLDAWLARRIDAMVQQALDAEADAAVFGPAIYRLPAPDAPDEDFEAFAAHVLWLANDRGTDNTRARLRALPELRNE